MDLQGSPNFELDTNPFYPSALEGAPKSTIRVGSKSHRDGREMRARFSSGVYFSWSPNNLQDELWMKWSLVQA